VGRRRLFDIAACQDLESLLLSERLRIAGYNDNHITNHIHHANCHPPLLSHSRITSRSNIYRKEQSDLPASITIIKLTTYTQAQPLQSYFRSQTKSYKPLLEPPNKQIKTTRENDIRRPTLLPRPLPRRRLHAPHRPLPLPRGQRKRRRTIVKGQESRQSTCREGQGQECLDARLLGERNEWFEQGQRSLKCNHINA
jgi:hypothetical protein